MKNPIINELKRLKLINNSNLITISNKTRDKKIKVFKDKKTKIIFLEKYLATEEYYTSLRYKDYDKKNIQSLKNKTTKLVSSGNTKLPC